MRKKVLLLFMMAFICIIYSYAEKVTVEKAEKVARTYANATPQLESKRNFKLSRTVFKNLKPSNQLRSSHEEPMYYVFSMNNNEGFIIISADDVAVPVLGYSEDGTYDENNPNFMYWMECLAQEIASSIENNVSSSAEIKAKWDIYLNENTTSLRASNAVVVAPLVKTRWNQDAPYNAMCPSGTVTGCVATAMAQVMKYWNYPTTGTGSHSYQHLTYGTLSANFGSTTYNWANMTNTYTSSSTDDEKKAVATLMYHCGVSVDMDYGPSSSGSSAYSYKVTDALVNYFGYDAGINYLSREYYSSVEWANIIKAEIDENCPVFYAGQGSSGHAFVCDGYDSNDLFHFNWGWGGTSDGYFELSALNPRSLGIGGGSGGYNTGQEIIVGIRPDSGGSPSNIRLGLSSLSSSKNSLSSLTETFNVLASHLQNIGTTTIHSLYWGILLCQQDDTPIEYKRKQTDVNLGLPSNSYYTSDYTIYSNYSLLPNLSPGTYKLYGAFSTTTKPDIAIKILGANGNKYITVIVDNDGKVTLSANSDSPVLTLQSLNVVGNLYKNRNGTFKAIITNTGLADYNSKLTIKLNNQAIITDPVVIPAGETKEVGFSETININQGSYPLSLWYDPNNNGTTPSLQLGSDQTVVVQQEPDPPILSATASFPNPNSVPANKPNLSVTVTNTGGIFDGIFRVYITTTESYSIIGNFGTKSITIKEGEGKTILFNDPLSLSAGNYRAWVYYSLDGSNYIQLSYGDRFTLTAPVYSSDATLSDLAVNHGTLSPTFNASTTNYTVNVTNDVNSIKITGIPNDEYATVKGIGVKSLHVGKNTFTIEVTAEDGTTKKQYSVTVDRAYQTYTWIAQSSTAWNDAANWEPAGVPSATSKVTIPKGASYPILTQQTTVGEILFKPGAELGRQDLLTYEKVYVQFDFDASSSRNRWWMLTNPLQEMYVGDLSFGGLPGMDITQFGQDNSGKGAWNPLEYEDKLEAGDNFHFWLAEDHPTEKTKGLRHPHADGIITLPHFETPEEANVHWTHDYDPVANKSTFYGWKKTGDVYERDGAGVLVDRHLSKAYKLADGSFMKELDAGLGVNGTAYFAATGNPFMSSISFEKLQEKNSSIIGKSYWVWIGAGPNNSNPGGYAVYNQASGETTGNTGVTLSNILVPMQSFIVEKNAESPNTQIAFNIATISATGQSEGARLRASAQSNDLLKIIASTPQSAFRAVIASREEGSRIFNDRDSRRFSAGINTLPDIYMLKPASNSSMVAVTADILSEIKEEITIPFAIATTYEGQISLSFTGMDSYNARIFLIDTDAPDKKETELTGQSHYEYIFNYVPKKENGTVTANENRFLIRLSPASQTGINPAVANNILIYSLQSNGIQIVSGELLQQVSIFNLQGQKIHDNASVNAYEYSVTGLSAGVYVVRAFGKQEIKTTKIIVK